MIFLLVSSEGSAAILAPSVRTSACHRALNCSYAGTNVAIEGNILEIRPNQDGSVDVFLEMSGDFLGLTTGVLCATYSSTLHGNLPPEGVPVKIYGMYKEVSARMMDGSSMTMPVMNAEYVVKR